MGKVRFGDIAESWLASKHSLKPSTAASYRNLLDARVLPSFAEVPVNAITAEAVRNWIGGMRLDGLSASRMRQATGVLAAVLDMAIRDRLLVVNVARDQEVPRTSKRDQRFLTAQQLELLAASADEVSEGSGLVVLTLGWVGMRFGELSGLESADVDLGRCRLHIRRNLTEVRGKLTEGSPKSHRTRTVVMPSWLAAYLKAHLAGHEHDAVFVSPRGARLRNNNWRRRVFTKAAKASGLDPGLQPHDLRHTAASLMIRSGAGIKTVQHQLGHASATMTLDLYGHLYEDQLDDLRNALDRLYDPRTLTDGQGATAADAAPPQYEQPGDPPPAE